MIQLPTRRARWAGCGGSSTRPARQATGRNGVHRRSFSFACPPIRPLQPPSARNTPAGIADPLRSHFAAGVRQCPCSPGDPLTEHPADTADKTGRPPVNVEDLHKLVLQSLDDDQALEVVSI